MSCSDESIWFKSVISRFTLLFIYLICFQIIGFNQNDVSGTWQLKLDVDNYVSVRKSWNSDETPVNIVVLDSNDRKIYGLSFIALQDEWNHFNFPNDFISYNEETLLNPQNLTFQIVEKRDIELNKVVYYDPSPNPLLQLKLFTSKERLDTNLVWGKLIDAYQWEDKIGINVVFRSELTASQILSDSSIQYTKHLYLYHYLKENGEFRLVRKFTDVCSGCSNSPNASFDYASIELTDLNRDTIGEISTMYHLYCSAEDTTSFQTKILLNSNDQKFMIRAQISPCSEESTSRILEVNGSSSFKYYEYIRRYLDKKLYDYYSED